MNEWYETELESLYTLHLKLLSRKSLFDSAKFTCVISRVALSPLAMHELNSHPSTTLVTNYGFNR